MRQDHIESFEIRFLLVMNSDVLDDLHSVLDEIASRIGEIEKVLASMQ
jgi:hypothetical protein